ncbi:MAG TPA: metal-dependent hydrolase [Terracidiphilus sp.]|nr:metal-dependent hydrolase [Terracidiphilus sp.]
MPSSQPTRITWLGHATVLIQTPAGTNILIDPFIANNPKYPKEFQLPSKIHYILVSHGHGDHISDAVPCAQRHGATIAGVYELVAYLGSKGASSTIGFNLGGTIQLDDAAVTMVDAKHSAGAQDEDGTHYVGVACGFVLTISHAPVLYHAGDTGIFGDMRLIRDLYHPKVAMLPIGGHYTMDPREAAMAVNFLEPEVVLPLHFGTFPQLTGTPAELAALVGSKAKVVDWKPAEVYTA